MTQLKPTTGKISLKLGQQVWVAFSAAHRRNAFTQIPPANAPRIEVGTAYTIDMITSEGIRITDETGQVMGLFSKYDLMPVKMYRGCTLVAEVNLVGDTLWRVNVYGKDGRLIAPMTSRHGISAAFAAAARLTNIYFRVIDTLKGN